MIYLALFFAVFVGYGVALLLKEKNAQQLSLPLAFSGAFLLAVTLFNYYQRYTNLQMSMWGHL